MSCECCWADHQRRALTCSGAPESRTYEATRADHEARKCVCTHDTEDGRKRRAGQFWDDDRRIDTRDVDPMRLLERKT